MHAIILAAGRGNRLVQHNSASLPKCLLEFGEKSLLQRQLEALWDCTVPRADLVVGFEADRIIEHVGRLHKRPTIGFHFNPRFEQGSVISLLAARATLDAGEDILLMDADVLFHPALLERLAKTEHANCVLLDRAFEPGDEPVKIALRDGLIVDLRKHLPDHLTYDRIGESVGFFRLEPAKAAAAGSECARFEGEGMADAPHEEVLRNLIQQQPDDFGVEDVTGLPWIEIDFAADVIRARERVLPAIRDDIPDF